MIHLAKEGYFEVKLFDIVEFPDSIWEIVEIHPTYCLVLSELGTELKKLTISVTRISPISVTFNIVSLTKFDVGDVITDGSDEYLISSINEAGYILFRQSNFMLPFDKEDNFRLIRHSQPNLDYVGIFKEIK